MPDDTEGRLAWDSGETWYRIVGDLEPDGGPAPLVILHGGPGAAHDYCEPIADLIAATGRACVLYDQLGCGKSGIADKPHDKEMWTVELFVEEVDAVREALGLECHRALVVAEAPRDVAESR